MHVIKCVAEIENDTNKMTSRDPEIIPHEGKKGEAIGKGKTKVEKEKKINKRKVEKTQEEQEEEELGKFRLVGTRAKVI